ncbi:uncharacterized protein LOC127246880 isoform X1 [Andrographis paniculata]|uniref:uncharacterized protein LOC127246880 isoform X1 n=1 Tax=Andrographis paniculata TaxID=175694 RepID=UPI0021E71B9C|nr:uncharacterized protein LOC127246880 isoform X1 [Andrographis paniculata]
MLIPFLSNHDSLLHSLPTLQRLFSSVLLPTCLLGHSHCSTSQVPASHKELNWPIARLNSNGQAMFDPSCLACVRMNDTEYVEMKPSSHQKISYKDGTLRDPGPQILLTVVVFCVVVWNWRSWSLVKGSRVVSEAQESKVQ